jgi:hypothetical protein
MRIVKTQTTSAYSKQSSYFNWDARPAFIGLVCLAAFILHTSGYCRTQARPSDPSRTSPSSKSPDRTVPSPTPKGKAGFRMVIPEIQMRSITGGPPGKRGPAPKEQLPTIQSPPRTPEPDEGSETGPGETTLPEKPVVPRLPFEPVDSSSKQVPEFTDPEKSDETPAKNIEIPLLKPPAAPEDAIEARAPKKEVLKGKIETSVPELLEGKQNKDTLKTLPIESLELDDVVDPQEWLPFQKRREPERLPGSEPAKEAEPKPEGSPEDKPQREQMPDQESLSPPQPDSLPGGQAQPLTPGEQAPGPELQPAPETPKEQPLQPQPDKPARESIPEEPPARSLPEPPSEEVPFPKEMIPSPLDSEAQESPELREYLEVTAPILEELSLLMTRVPSLTIADFDPSDAEAPVVPKELFIQMDSMKRNLQILDSKTFAVIPPNKYSRFHTIIRDSISHTHQACDAIINFFTQGDITALQRMQEHLIKARDLIRRTRDKTGQG